MTPFTLFQYLIAAALGGIILLIPTAAWLAMLTNYYQMKAVTRVTERQMKEEDDVRN
jgi:hypothetical protein